ncbi:MAG: hypothetical protein KF864_01775 [Phycisphaeraceae bacterium]|nr:hypothetical protein [Phycisphaeraceae bacterium]
MPTNEELRPLFLLSDEPLIGDEPDDLQREQDARLIAEVVLGNRGPFAIGVYGEWGSGKTTLLHRVRRLLSAEKPGNNAEPLFPYIVPVYFNAWQYGRDKEPIAFLAAEIRDAIALHLKSLQTPTDKAGEMALSWLRSAMDVARAGIYGVSAGIQDLVSGVNLTISPKDMIDRYDAFQNERQDPNSRVWKEHVDKSVVAASLRSMRADDHALGELRPGEERRIPRVVVFIDDLDRCTAEEAVTILRGIKLALSQPGFIFVLTLNPKALLPYVNTLSVSRGHTPAGTYEAGAVAGQTIYLDKLIQLPYALRLRRDRFGAFCTTTIKERLKDHVPSEMHATLITLRPALRDSSLNNPRTFKRLLNEVLIAAQRASGDLLAELDPSPDKARALLAGLHLLQDIPRRFNQPDVLRELSAKQDLCDAISAHTLEILARAVHQCDDERLHESIRRPLGAVDASADLDITRAATTHKQLITALDAVTPLNGLFKSDFGTRWLKEPLVRQHLEIEWSLSPPLLDFEPEGSTPTTMNQSVATSTQEATPASSQPSTPARKAPRFTEQVDRGLAAEIALIERAARKNLNLDESQDLTPEQWAQVTQLHFPGPSITDRGIAWLVRADSGLSSLASLRLRGEEVSNEVVKQLARADTGLKALKSLTIEFASINADGAKELARTDTGLKTLESLNIGYTDITDAGMKDLARENTGLKALTSLSLVGNTVKNSWATELARSDTGLSTLTSLSLDRTDMTDDGVKILADANTGLKNLTTLYLSGNELTAAAARGLSRPDSGLKALTALFLTGYNVTDEWILEISRSQTSLKALSELGLWYTHVTEAGIKDLSRADTGLGALTSLSITGPNVTDTIVQELARSDTKLKALIALNLWNSQISDAGVKILARPDTGLMSLTTLNLGCTRVTDKGINELARASSGLKTLTTLILSHTQVTDAGVEDLTRADTGLKDLAVLDLSHTPVTDAGVTELTRTDTGLKALAVLDLSHTSVTDAGVMELVRQDTGLSNLATLVIRYTNVTAAAMRSIKEQPSRLKVIYSPPVTLLSTT